MNEGMGLRERKKRETRRRLLETATTLFSERGFDQVSVAEIADAADVSKMTVFNYFDSKEDLVFAPLEEHVATPPRSYGTAHPANRRWRRYAVSSSSHRAPRPVGGGDG